MGAIFSQVPSLGDAVLDAGSTRRQRGKLARPIFLRSLNTSAARVPVDSASSGGARPRAEVALPAILCLGKLGLACGLLAVLLWSEVGVQLAPDGQALIGAADDSHHRCLSMDVGPFGRRG